MVLSRARQKSILTSKSSNEELLYNFLKEIRLRLAKKFKYLLWILVVDDWKAINLIGHLSGKIKSSIVT